MQISSNHIIPGAISCPFILSEDYPFRPPPKTGGDGQESLTRQIINLVLTTTRKAPSQHISLSIFLAVGMDTLTTPATTMKPRPWLFQYLNSLARCLTPPLAPAIGSGHAQHSVSVLALISLWSLFGSNWLSSLSPMEVSFSPSVSRSWL